MSKKTLPTSLNMGDVVVGEGKLKDNFRAVKMGDLVPAGRPIEKKDVENYQKRYNKNVAEKEKQEKGDD